VVIAFRMGLGGTAHAACGPKAGAGLGLVSPSCLLPWAKLAPALSTAPAEEGSQIGSIVGLWLVTFECDGAVWDVGFDQWHSDGTDFEPLKAGWRRYSLPVGTFRRGTPPPNQSFTAVGPGRGECRSRCRCSWRRENHPLAPGMTAPFSARSELGRAGGTRPASPPQASVPLFHA